MKFNILVLVLFAIGTLSAHNSLNDTILLNEVKVISTTKIQVNRNQVPATVSVVGREEIDESGESALLPVLSGRIPGLFVTERGVTGFGVSKGSAGTVNIRGVGDGNKVLMLFDGQPQWAGIFGHHLPDTYVASDVERVEVIRGPASVLYGSNAMGGVVNIITRKSDKNGLHGSGRLSYGSYNTQKYMANAGLKKNKLNIFTSLNHDRTDGHRPHSKFYITNGYAKAGYNITPNWNISGDATIAKFKTNNPNITDNWVDALRATYSFSLENNYGKTSGALRAFYNCGDHEVNDGWKAGKPRDYLFQSRDHNAGFMLYQSIRPFSGNMLTAGVDFKNWGGHAWNEFMDKDVDIIDKTVNETAVYLISQQNLFDKLTLNAGLRLEINQTYDSEWVPQAGIAYRPTNSTTFKTSVSKGFRSPNLKELYLYEAANPDLKPESMMNYDVTISQSFIDGILNIELTAFLADGKDMIQQISVDKKPKNMNTGSFINKGIEFAANYKILPTLKLTANYSYLHTDNPVIAAPRHQTYIGATYRIDRLTLSANTQFVDKLYTGNATDTGTYTLLNARAVYKFTKWISVFANGDNLTSRRYTINAGYPMPGFIFMGGFDFKF